MKDMIKEKDFIEIEFAGKIKDGDIFDTNIKKEAKKININIETRPLIICIGQGMMLKAIDEFLKNKKLGDYVIELSPENAFGYRNSRLVKIMPLSIFKKQDIQPLAGMMFSFDGMLGKISAVSSGRIIVDFNNPLSGKTLIYNIKAKRKINDINEKINALQDFFFRNRFKFNLNDDKIIFEKKAEIASLFKDKFKEILNLDLEIEKREEEKTRKEAEKSKEEKKN